MFPMELYTSNQQLSSGWAPDSCTKPVEYDAYHCCFVFEAEFERVQLRIPPELQISFFTAQENGKQRNGGERTGSLRRKINDG